MNEGQNPKNTWIGLINKRVKNDYLNLTLIIRTPFSEMRKDFDNKMAKHRVIYMFQFRSSNRIKRIRFFKYKMYELFSIMKD